MFDIYFLQEILNGLSIGLSYALMAIGFTLIFGVLGAVNLAHGEIYTLGAFTGLMVIVTLAPPLIVVVLVVLAVGAFLGFGLERIAFRPLRRFTDESIIRSRALRESTLLSSLAVGIVVRELINHVTSGQHQPVPDAFMLDRTIAFGRLTVNTGEIMMLGVSFVMLLGLQVLLYRTRIGRSIRAVSANLVGAQHVGININRTIIATFMVGSMLGAVSGLIVALEYGSIDAEMGFAPLIKAFAAMVMGGLTSIPGAVIAALVLGVAESLASYFWSAGWADLIVYSILIVTLIFFPRGLFPQRS